MKIIQGDLLDLAMEGRFDVIVQGRRDWESAKVSIMTDAVRTKFAQHDDIRAILLATGDAKIIEHTENDSHWGDGGDGSGRNMLGEILMRVRTELREAK